MKISYDPELHSVLIRLSKTDSGWERRHRYAVCWDAIRFRVGAVRAVVRENAAVSSRRVGEEWQVRLSFQPRNETVELDKWVSLDLDADGGVTCIHVAD